VTSHKINSFRLIAVIASKAAGEDVLAAFWGKKGKKLKKI
jgi:hypothetical protein